MGTEAYEKFKSRFDNFFREEASNRFEQLWKNSRFHRGEYRRIKNASLYVDVDESEKIVSTPSDVSHNDATEIIEQAGA